TIQTDEDVAVSLGLQAPAITDNGSGTGNNPETERLGEITLEGFPEGAKLLDANGTELHTFDASGKITIELNDVAHIDGLSVDHTMSSADFEGLQVLPPAEDHKNFDVTYKVTSYEVDDNNQPLAGVDGAESDMTVTVNV